MSEKPKNPSFKKSTTDLDETVFAPPSANFAKDAELDETVFHSASTDADLKARPNIPATPPTPARPAVEHGKRAAQLGIGSEINNRFVIDSILGKGGMGIVYRALDKRKQEAQDHNPYVAVKVLGKDFESHPQAFIALQRETRKSQTLAHPNIITVYDFDRDGDTVYMTMEELRGKTLDVLIRENREGLPAKQAVQIIKSIAEGLAYAHSKGIVHSDLKPGNIFITDDESVKVLDFGIARAVSSLTEETGDKTVFDAKDLGGLTPSYASSEMFAGKAPSPSDDIYALGLIGYELLTGAHPYGRTPANVALTQNLAPARIKGIKSYQARALLDSIALKQSMRIEDAASFLARFDKTPASTKALIFGAFLAAAVLSPIIMFRPDNTGPEIPFEQLSPELQQEFTTSYNNGNEAYSFGDYNGALFFYNEAYELHPRNPDAVAGLDTVIDAILGVDDPGADNALIQERLRQIEILLEYPSLAENQRLLEMQQSLLGEP